MKSSAGQIDNYIARLRERGTHDSEGVFTVAGTRALGKLSSFLLPDKSDWLLKIVQSACAYQAPELHIKQTHRSTQVSFQVPEPIDLALFENAISSTSIPKQDSGMADLLSGLRAVGVGQERDWITRLTVGGESSFVTCVEGQLSSQRLRSEDAVPEGHSQALLGVAYPASESGKIGGLIRFGEAVQNEHQVLLHRTRACPIPLYLDGRRIDDLCEPGLSNVLQSRAFLGFNSTDQPGYPPIPIPGGLMAQAQSESRDFFSQSPLLVSTQSGGTPAGSIQRWYYNYARREEAGKSHVFLQAVPTPSRVHLVRRGVLVGRKNLGISHPISADVFLNADHLRSDLTGLQLEPDTEAVELAREGMRRSMDFLRSVEAKLIEIESRPIGKDLWLYGGLGVLSLLSPWFALKAVTGAVSGIMIARAVKNDRRALRDCINQLNDFFQLTSR